MSTWIMYFISKHCRNSVVMLIESVLKGTNVFLVFPVESNIYDETFCMYYIKRNCQLFVYIHFH